MTPAPDRPDAPIVQKLLSDVEAALKRSGLPDDEIAAALVEIRRTLIEAAQTEPDPTEGGPKVVKGQYFFGLEDMGGKAMEIGMRKTVLRLDDEQKMVCVAIMEIDRRKRSRTFIEPGASAGEIAAYFTKRDENVPPLLEQMLADLSRRNPPVLAAASYGGRGPFYQVRF